MTYELNYNTKEKLKKENIELCKAKIEELDDITDLYKKRIKWFKDNNINQWQDYFKRHPIDEFINAIKDERMFYLKKNNEIIAAFELATEISYCDKGENTSFYICKLVTKIGYKNICDIVFNICKNIAINNNIKHLRLICIESNKKLNDIYEKYGFEFLDVCNDEHYNYNLRQLTI